MTKSIKIARSGKHKVIFSEDFNSIFNLKTGFTQTWGRTKDENPAMCPVSPLILDIEISTICNKKCSACYKSNTSIGKNMSLTTYQNIIRKFPKAGDIYFLQSVAIGIGSVSGNSELFDILNWTREQDIIPNITVNGQDITDQEIINLSNVCGAVAVSHYNDRDCFDTIHRLSEARKASGATLQQINIHQIYCVENHNDCIKLLHKIDNNKQLKSELNAVVFLALKPRGRRNKLTPSQNAEGIGQLMDLAKELDIAIGFDSCSAPSVLKHIEKTGETEMAQYIQPCESCLESFYINVDGLAFPCSFAEGVGEWVNGIDMLQVSDFQSEVWLAPCIVEWREKLINSSQSCSSCLMRPECRSCPIYDITPCKKR